MRILRAVVLSSLALLLLGAAWLGFVWPPPSWYRTHFPSKTAFMRLRERQLRARLDSVPLRYQPLPLETMSSWLPRAAQAGEDEAFYQHHGIDWRSLRVALGYRRDHFDWSSSGDRRDLWRAVRGSGARRDRLRGASTITQQLAKNLYLSPSRNPLRKVKEAAIAYRLEWALSKDRILELYLNVAELGPNLWGVEAASQAYFGRSAERLTMDQAALLIATLPHPLSSNPAHRPGRALWRQRLIARKLGGEDVVVPQEVDETDAPPPADSLAVPTDTMAQPADSIPQPPDTLLPVVPQPDTPRALPDTSRTPPDTTKKP